MRLIPLAALVLSVAALAGAGCGAPVGGAPADDAYPADITPPAGTQYPCALKALPRGLPGVPEADRGYINRTYARVLRATHSKLVVLKALTAGAEVEAALARYQQTTSEVAGRLRAEPAPAGLQPFQDDVVEALALQQAFFAKAGPLRLRGGSMAEVYLRQSQTLWA